MSPELIIVRPGEMTLKGRNRKRFEQKLTQQIGRLLKPFAGVKLRTEFGRLYIVLNGENYEPVAAELGKVFGFVSYSPAVACPLELEAIEKKALEWMKGLPVRPSTFKVSVRRANKDFPLDSQQLAHLIGGYILKHLGGIGVDVHSPDAELRIEVRDECAYMYTDIIPSEGGFPVGTNGKALLLLSGGIDSPVAGWLAMRRGLELEGIHFHSFPYTSERAKQKVIDLTRKLSAYTNGLTLHMVSFTDIQMRLKAECQPNLLITLMRRSMLRIAEKLAALREARAIVTGESLGQVASQTLGSLDTIGRAASLPILRPLIMTDKDDIIRIAQRIDTFDISILPYEDCCTLFVPASPSTNPNLRVVERAEARMSWLAEAEREAVGAVERLRVSADDKSPEEQYF